MSIIQVALIAVTSTIVALIIKSVRPEFTIYISLIVCAIIFMYGLSKIASIFDTVRNISRYINLNDMYITTLLKIIGVSYISEFAADLCRDSGHGAVANQIGIFGKVSILAISMPIINALIETVNLFLNG